MAHAQDEITKDECLSPRVDKGGITAEGIPLRRIGYMGADGVQVDIAGEPQKVRVLVDEDGFKPALIWPDRPLFLLK